MPVYSQLGFPRPPKLVPQTFVWRPPFFRLSAQGDNPTIPHFVKPSKSAPHNGTWYSFPFDDPRSSRWMPQAGAVMAPARHFLASYFRKISQNQNRYAMLPIFLRKKVNGFSRLELPFSGQFFDSIIFCITNSPNYKKLKSKNIPKNKEYIFRQKYSNFGINPHSASSGQK